MKAVILYRTKTGNTERVAVAMKECIDSVGLAPEYLKVEEAEDVDFFDYDLICLGFPSYRWRPPKEVDDFLVAWFNKYREQKRVRLGSPKLPGENVIIFCTYSGPHTGINEAIPATKYAAQFFEHLGFTILDELYVVGEFHGREDASTKGRLGDIRGRPNRQDLANVKMRVKELLNHV